MSKLINIIGIAMFFILSLFSFVFSQESMTITTYYPSPYGSYKLCYSVRYAANVTGATYTVDLNNGNVQQLTLTTSSTFSFSNNLYDGAIYTLLITQDATGSRLITWSGNWKWPGGTLPTLTTTANAVDIFTFVSNGTNLYNIGFAADVR